MDPNLLSLDAAGADALSSIMAASEHEPQASTSAIAMDASDANGHQSPQANGLEASQWRAAAGDDDMTLAAPPAAPIASGSGSVSDAQQRQTLSAAFDVEDDFAGQYSGPRPGAEAALEYNEGADWPSKAMSGQRLRRHSFIDSGPSSDEEDSATGSIVSQRPRKIRTGLVYSSVMMLHAIPTYVDPKVHDDHPESPDRIMVIFEKLKERGLVRRMKRIAIREATLDEIMLVHDKSIWDGVQRTAFFSHESLSAQTHLLNVSSLYINEHSALCARLSCGGVVEMCDAVATGRVRNGFAIVRPPGHHAEPDQPMGFCLYNNVAVAACYLRERYGHLEGPRRCKKILILDWDVHHGNGTQTKFYDDPDILYISLHRYDNGVFFPAGGAGDHDKVGGGDAKGRNINVPWPGGGMGDGDYIAAFYRIVMPIATEFAPDLVIISAGFDAARGDPLGECDVTPLGYAHMTYDLACLANGRLVVALEGGYSLKAIANSALAVTEVLLGEAPAAMPAGLMCSAKADDTIKLVERSQSPYWQCMQRPHLEAEPDEDEDLPQMQFAELIALHRAQQLAVRYDLSALPIKSDSFFVGQGLCSEDLLMHPRRTLVVFVHDMGNLRVEEFPSIDINLKQELFTFVDGSSQVLDWARANDMSIVDICLHFQLPTQAKMPTSRGGRRTTVHEVPMLEDACSFLRQIWDNYVDMARTVQSIDADAQHRTDIVLIGLGTACAAVMNLIEQKHPRISKYVRAIVQIPGHSTIPSIPKGDKELRKWYYNNTLTILPYNHAYYTHDVQAQAGKRLGQVVRSREHRAIQVLRAEIDRVQDFVDKQLPYLAEQRAASNGSAATNGHAHEEEMGSASASGSRQGASPSAHGGLGSATSAIVID